jgi:dynein heavy chain 2
MASNADVYFRNLKKTEDRKRKLEDLLNSVGQKVSELKEK